MTIPPARDEPIGGALARILDRAWCGRTPDLAVAAGTGSQSWWHVMSDKPADGYRDMCICMPILPHSAPGAESQELGILAPAPVPDVQRRSPGVIGCRSLAAGTLSAHAYV